MTIREYIRMNPQPEGMSNRDYFNLVAEVMGVHWSSVEKPFYSERKWERTRYTEQGGRITSETYSAVPVDKESTKGMAPAKITTNPYGGQWVKYERPDIDVKQARKQIVSALAKKIKPYKIPKQKGKGTTLVVLSADKHFGAHTKRNSVYNNEYSPKVFRQRHDQLLDQIYQESKRFGTFDELVYFDLGDLADGWNGKTTRGGHHLPQNLDNLGQWREAVKEHKRAFDKLIDMHPAAKYRYIGAANSNHGGDFDQIIMETIAGYVQVKYPDIVTHVSDRPFDHVQIGQHSYIYGHGKDAEDMKTGMPLNLNDKAENWINDYINQKKLTGIIHFVAGDQHQSAMNYGKRFRYRRVLSLYGASKWIHTNFGSGRPGVSYDILHGEQVYTVDLML